MHLTYTRLVCGAAEGRKDDTLTSRMLTMVLKMTRGAAHWEGALELYDMMRAQGLPVGRDIFETLVQTCADAGRVSHAHELLGTMHEQGHAPSAHDYNACMVAYNRAGNPTAALELFDHMEREKCAGDAVTYSAAVAAAAAAQQVLLILIQQRNRYYSYL